MVPRSIKYKGRPEDFSCHGCLAKRRSLRHIPLSPQLVASPTPRGPAQAATRPTLECTLCESVVPQGRYQGEPSDFLCPTCLKIQCAHCSTWTQRPKNYHGYDDEFLCRPCYNQRPTSNAYIYA